MNRRTIFIILGGLVVLVLGGVAIFTALRLQETTDESVAPNAPQSQPRAQQNETLPDNPVQVTFNVTGTASPSPTGTASPTAAPASAPTTAPTSAPATTSTPSTAPAAGGPASTATAKPAATAAPSTSSGQTLPEAGMSMPTILGVFGGALLLVAGLVLAL